MRDLREAELESLAKTQHYRAINLFFMNLNPVALAVGTFIAFAAFEGDIEPAQAFQALALFNLLVWPLMLFPRTISDLLETLVAVNRIEGYLLSSTVDDTEGSDSSEELEGGPEGAVKPKYRRYLGGVSRISLKDATFSWRADAPPVLIAANLEVRAGELIGVVGTTGSG